MCYSTDLFCCIVKSLLKKFPLKSHESKNILNEWIHLATSLGLWSCTAFTVWFKDTSAGWHSLPKQRLKPRPPTAVEGQTLCSVFFQTYIQGQSNQMESRPGPAANRGWASASRPTEHQLNTSTGSPFLPLSPLTPDLANKYKWDWKYPLDTAIKNHFKIMQAKV